VLLSSRELRKAAIHATDGDIGHVDDIYFETGSWNVRYLVVDTGKWLPGRRVLISPESVAGGNLRTKDIHLNLTKDQIRNSPDVSTDRPISEQVHADLSAYYGWTYMPTGLAPGAGMVPSFGMIPPAIPEYPEIEMPPQEPAGDENLTSFKEVLEYLVEGDDGDIGLLEDLALKADRPRVEWLVAGAAKHGHRQVYIPVDAVIDIEWTRNRVRVRGSRDDFADKPFPGVAD
jgi:PRC-barrel domain